jgi:hypothetical protein
MTDLCHATGKRKLTSVEALVQAKHSRRKVIARRCPDCGAWHANSAGVFQNREEKRRTAKIRTKRAEAYGDDE